LTHVDWDKKQQAIKDGLNKGWHIV